MTSRIIGYIVAIAVLIFLSGYFSATETAFTSLNRIRIKNMASDGSRRARRVLELSDNYDTLLTTILIGNNIVNILTTVIATLLFVEIFGSLGPTVATVVTTVAVLIFGEITPKSLAKEAPESFSMVSAPVIKILMVVFKPLNILFSAWKRLVSLIFKIDKDKGVTEEELLTMVEEAETEGEFDEERSELIQNAIEFNDLEAWDVLTPRVDVMAIDVHENKDDILKTFRDSGFSRLPVYDDEIDNILGVLNQKDFHNYVYGRHAEISEYVAPVVFAPETMKIPVLLKKLQTEKTHMAVIIDEYGGMAGIVTMEDIIEELVGEIYDEHDTVISQEIMPLYDGSYRVKANTDIDKLFDFFDVEDKTDANTVNGWVVRELNKLPDAGDSFEYECDNKLFRAKVTKADERKALEINLTVETLPETDE
ncbi:MAG: hemolysin family protein [Anaerovoracaceae bacterium]|nr:hemolysin family protein [Anaerovoracaceae bacterium]